MIDNPTEFKPVGFFGKPSTFVYIGASVLSGGGKLRDSACRSEGELHHFHHFI